MLTMNTRGAALSEGLANNAILMAHGVKELEELPDADLRIGILLALLQDDAKNQSSWLTWEEGRPQEEVARCSGASTSAPRSAPESSPAPGAATRSTAACTCRATAPAPRRWPSSGGVTRRRR